MKKIFILFTFIFTLTSSAQTTPTVNITGPTQNIGGLSLTGVNNTKPAGVGQSFIAVASGSLSVIEFSVSGVTTAGTFSLQLFTGTNTLLTPIHSQTLSISTTGLKSVTLTTNPAITLGSTYAFVLKTTNGNMALTYTNTSVYTGGSVIQNNSALTNSDLWFNIKMIGLRGAALAFSGTNAFVQCSNPSSSFNFTAGSPFSIELWAQRTGTTSGNDVTLLTSRNPSSAVLPGYELGIDPSGRITFYLCSNFGTGNYIKVTTINPVMAFGVFHHIAVTYGGSSSASGVIIYIDGVNTPLTVNNNNLTGPITTTTPVIWLGSANGFNALYGKLDEVRIWNLVRTQCQINTFKDCEIPTSSTGLLANYHFNYGIHSYTNSAITLADFSGNANTGTLAGIALSGLVSNWSYPGGVVNGYTTSIATPTVVIAPVSPLICLGNSVVLNASGASTYTWNTSVQSNSVVVSPTISTVYSVTGTNTLTACTSSDVVNVTVSACTVTENLSLNSPSFILYPNPSTGLYNLQTSTDTEITVVNVLGKTILNTKINPGSFQINLNEQANGIYFLKANSSGQIKTIRLIKQ